MLPLGKTRLLPFLPRMSWTGRDIRNTGHIGHSWRDAQACLVATLLHRIPLPLLVPCVTSPKIGAGDEMSKEKGAAPIVSALPSHSSPLALHSAESQQGSSWHSCSPLCNKILRSRTRQPVIKTTSRRGRVRGRKKKKRHTKNKQKKDTLPQLFSLKYYKSVSENLQLHCVSSPCAVVESQGHARAVWGYFAKKKKKIQDKKGCLGKLVGCITWCGREQERGEGECG